MALRKKNEREIAEEKSLRCVDSVCDLPLNSSVRESPLREYPFETLFVGSGQCAEPYPVRRARTTKRSGAAPTNLKG